MKEQAQSFSTETVMMLLKRVDRRSLPRRRNSGPSHPNPRNPLFTSYDDKKPLDLHLTPKKLASEQQDSDLTAEDMIGFLFSIKSDVRTITIFTEFLFTITAILGE